ncbi:MAG: methylated-DNA-[protein]-cysteine S-methyltransferase [Planctomycetota bacterium]|jgi:methylated-DNA-[protein]-cysteine S-methyltransferase
MKTASIARLTSPLGDLLAAVSTAGELLRLDFHDGRGRPSDEGELAQVLESEGWSVRGDSAVFGQVETELGRYFSGDSDAFAALSIAPSGTAFQLEVWSALRRIPWGQTTSYGELAHSIGRPTAARAIGMANGANVIALAIPCHRVIGKDGALTGYAGGIDRKRSLLSVEGVRAAESDSRE